LPSVSATCTVAVHLAVAEAHLAGHLRLLLRRQRQAQLAAEQLAAQAEHLVVDVVVLVGVQDLRRAAGQRELCGDAIVHGLQHHHLLGEDARHLAELAVERLVGDALGHQPGQRHAHRPQQQQRREHPVEDLAEEGALFLAGVRHRRSG
jgi:hypothetical protein